MELAVTLVFLPIAVIIVVLALGVSAVVRRRQFARLRELAPDAFLFTFSSNRPYQAALLELRERGIMNPKSLTDSEDPFTKGPRWVAASARGLQIRRGYGAKAVFGLTWDQVSSIRTETIISRGYAPSASAAIAVGVIAGDRTIWVVFTSPDSRVNSLSGDRQAKDVVEQLNRLRPLD